MRVCKLLAYVNLYLCCGVALNLAMFVDHVTYTRRLEGEKTTLEQEIKELQRKLEVSEQQCTDVEAKLVEGALTMAGHAVGILKSYTPGLDIGVISCGYNCDRDQANEFFCREPGST